MFFCVCFTDLFRPVQQPLAIGGYFSLNSNYGKLNKNFKSSSSAKPATFQELSWHVGLAVAVLVPIGRGSSPSRQKVLGPEADECGEETSEHLLES